MIELLARFRAHGVLASAMQSLGGLANSSAVHALPGAPPDLAARSQQAPPGDGGQKRHYAKRFYKNVLVEQVDGESPGWQLFLDKHSLKTPGKHPLRFPTKSLALAIAAEWEWQDRSKPQMFSMPLMGIAATALDQPKARDKVIDTMMKYLHTDSAVVRYEPGKMADRQAKMFDPLLQWAEERLHWKLHTSDSMFGTVQSKETEALARSVLEGLDPWHLAATEQITAVSKSLLVAMASMHGHVGVDEAIRLARCEEEFQTEEWGEVEAGHDLDKADIGSRIAAPHIFLRLLKLEVGSKAQ
eukprot:gene28981-32169_t